MKDNNLLLIITLVLCVALFMSIVGLVCLATVAVWAAPLEGDTPTDVPKETAPPTKENVPTEAPTNVPDTPVPTPHPTRPTPIFVPTNTDQPYIPPEVTPTRESVPTQALHPSPYPTGTGVGCCSSDSPDKPDDDDNGTNGSGLPTELPNTGDEDRNTRNEDTIRGWGAVGLLMVFLFSFAGIIRRRAK